MKLLGLFLIRWVFTKKILRDQKFVETGTGKNRGFPEHCALVLDSYVILSQYEVYLVYSVLMRLENPRFLFRWKFRVNIRRKPVLGLKGKSQL